MCLVINNYEAGDTLFPHLDSVSEYGALIVGVSLGSARSASMFWGHQDVASPPRSLYVMSGRSRYELKHGMRRMTEGRRVSLTFRRLSDDLLARLAKGNVADSGERTAN